MTLWEVKPHYNEGYIYACKMGSSLLVLRIAAQTSRPHDKDVMVLHERGHKYFGGQFQPQNYSPAQYIVLRATDKDGEWEEVITFPVSRQAQ